MTKGLVGERDARAAWWAFVLISAALLPVMVAASFDFGVTWDEKSRHKYGEMIIELFRGLRTRASLPQDDGRFYGGVFDAICAAVEPWVPVNRYVLRHALNAAFGWAGVVYAGRLAGRLFGRWSGVLALVLLATSPRYFADSMNNPKDLPFAAAAIAIVYYLSTISPQWPYISRSTGIKIAVAVGVALNIRPMALLYVGYLGLLVGAYMVSEAAAKHAGFAVDRRRLVNTALVLTGVVAGGLLVGTVFWPWAQSGPFTRPFEALLGFSSYPYVSTMLFAGRVVVSTELPWYYSPWWFLITTPPVVIAGIALSVVSRARVRAPGWYALWAIAIFPVTLVIVKHSTLYDGVRHLLFIYPVLVVLAASGWTAWLRAEQRPWTRWGAAVLLAAGLANVLAFDVRSHPNQAVYFNEIVGGPRGAFARYEMDYWGNCMLEAVAWSATTARLSGVAITISGLPDGQIQLDSERFHELSFAPPYRNQQQLDVLLAKGSAQGVTGLATRPDALYRVRTHDGAVLCAVVPGPAFAELQSRLKTPPPGLSAHQLLRP